VIISIPEAFNFDVATWNVGSSVDCSVLSAAMCSFGRFPESLLVREEMKAVWSIVIGGLTGEPPSQWVIVGSPGVGKSVLTVLLCFHLAKKFNVPVVFARQLKGESGPQQGSVIICIRPGGEAVGYPKRREDKFDMKTISAEFGSQFEAPVRTRTVLDGWSQSELTTTTVGADFGGFDLLATSAQFVRKSQDTRLLVSLPAWKERDLQLLADLHGMEPKDFEERLFHAGGAAREFLRSSVDEIRHRINEATVSMTEESCKGLLAGYGGSTGTVFDTLRRCYLSNEDEESYKDASCWVFAVDSLYALRRLRTKASLAVFERALMIAKGSGKAHYGWAFEALVHQLFFVNRAVTLHLKRDPSEAVAVVYESVSIGSDFSVECIGRNVNEAKDFLRSRTIDVARSSYWHPDYPSLPIIDGIACVPNEKTVWYIQLTVGEEKNVDLPELAAIHRLVKASLARSLGLEGSDIAGWKFRYVVIEPSLEDANRLNLKEKGAKRKLDGSTVGEVSILKGYLAY
jgi:hypothetical protein